MKWRYRILFGVVVIVVGLWLNNTSLFVDTTANETKLLSHRGVHQTYHRENLENDTCTAERIYPVTHEYIENTIPSMQAAFDAGADVVELDVHLTTDRQFAVFHDWTLDCRTIARGVTEETSMFELQILDVGYGYTADGGQTYPLRGKGVGLMPSLTQVFEALPDRQFLVNYKSNRMQEGEALVAMLTEHPEWVENVFGVYGGSAPTNRVRRADFGIPGYDRQSLLDCLLPYIGLGWSGYIPDACRDGLVAVPQNLGWLLWGWPHKFTQRMADAGTEVFMVGPYAGDFTVGIDDAETLAAVPENFDGYVWTNKIETIGPLLRSR